ncbi:hypothetical protein [Streptomyces sp. NPDC047097]|uniref:hypothetical protein n=1 Tax=Streptomyces sp. NPDC047097 TaxID=3155260 RepID=UPI0033DCB401
MNFRTKPVAVAAVTTGLLVGMVAAPAVGQPVPPPTAIKSAPIASTSVKLPARPCSEDDSSSRNCYWDAARMGNGKGYSYVVDAAGNVTYLEPRLNDSATRRRFVASKEAAGWEFWGSVWGHQLCWAKVGDTSYIHCLDGFRETS